MFNYNNKDTLFGDFKLVNLTSKVKKGLDSFIKEIKKIRQFYITFLKILKEKQKKLKNGMGVNIIY